MSDASEVKASNPRAVSGVVVSDRMEKSITVKVERRVKHPVYGKYIKQSKKFHVHDPENQCQEGDEVTIEEAKKMSKTKSWALKSIDRKATVI